MGHRNVKLIRPILFRIFVRCSDLIMIVKAEAWRPISLCFASPTDPANQDACCSQFPRRATYLPSLTPHQGTVNRRELSIETGNFVKNFDI